MQRGADSSVARDHLDAIASTELRVGGVNVVAALTDQSRRKVPDEA